MHPQHFLPHGTVLLVNFDGNDGNRSHKMYRVASDGALRTGQENTADRLPSLAGPQDRAPADNLNPFLVAINADMAFRRFKRNPVPLCADYEELVDLTIKLADKIYFQPLVDQIEDEIEKIRSGRIVAVECAKETQTQEEVHMEDESTTEKADDDEEKPITNKEAARFSRTGRLVKKPGPGASHEETIDYFQYLMSGRGMFFFSIGFSCSLTFGVLDHELTSDDEELLEELGLDYY